MQSDNDNPQSDIVFVIEEELSPAEIRLLGDRLYEFNVGMTGQDDGRWLVVTRRDAQGDLLAAIHGWTWARWMKVNYFWVSEEHRRKGWGQMMLSMAEEEARRRGCAHAFLTTYSFQAPDFYEKMGYRIQQVFKGLPEGHVQLTMVKDLRCIYCDGRAEDVEAPKRKPQVGREATSGNGGTIGFARESPAGRSIRRASPTVASPADDPPGRREAVYGPRAAIHGLSARPQPTRYAACAAEAAEE